MAVPSWTASTSVSASALVKPTTTTGNGLIFCATNAGTTGTAQPIWPTTFGGTVTDGTVTWRAVSQVTGEFQSLQPSSIIELFELQLTAALHGSNDVYRFHAGANANNNGDVVWAGNTYQRFPIEADGFEYGGQGQLPRPKVRVSNVFGTITAVLATLPSGLERAKVTRIRTLARYLDAANFPGSVNPFGTPDPSAEFPREIYYIDRKTTENRDVIEFELAASFDLQGVRAPKRQCVANICPWVYRSAECGYTEPNYYTAADEPTASSALDVCGKRLSSCELRFSRITRTGSTTLGSATLTLDSTANLLAGFPIAGPGLATGTTVVSVNSATTLTMSAAALATTSQQKTGTPSATSAVLTVTNATGLAIGMSVTGQYIAAGTTITAISGTTLTLSQRPYAISRAGIYSNIYVEGYESSIKLSTTSGLSVGMRVFGTSDLSSSATISSLTSTTVTLNNGDTDSVDGKSIVAYFVPSSPPSSTYTIEFSSAPVYVFRADGGLPFGGFPGIGTYYT